MNLDIALPPQDLEAERWLLGSVIVGPEFLPEAAQLVDASSFYSSANGVIWNTVAAIADRGEKIDSVTLRNELAKRGEIEAAGGDSHLYGLTSDLPWHGATAAGYARIVREKHQRRTAIYAMLDGIRDAYDESSEWPDGLNKIDGQIQKLLANTTDAATVDVGDLMTETIEKLSRPKQPGLKTGIAGLDRLTNGLQAGQLVTIAARPGVGKSALALSVARHAALEAGTLFLSLEMSSYELAQRLLCAETGIPLKWLPRAVTDESQADTIHDALQRIGRLRQRLHVCDTAEMTVRDVAAIARVTQRKHGLGLLVVDYLQLLSPDDRKAIREQQISAMTRGLKLLGKALGIPVVMLSQLNRDVEKRDSKRPRLADLRESGAIEQDSDVVVMPWCPDEKEPERVELAVLKHRNGPTADVRLTWDAATMQFSDPAPEPCEWDLPAEVDL